MENRINANLARQDQVLAAWILSKCGPKGLAVLSYIALSACKHSSDHARQSVLEKKSQAGINKISGYTYRNLQHHAVLSLRYFLRKCSIAS